MKVFLQENLNVKLSKSNSALWWWYHKYILCKRE